MDIDIEAIRQRLEQTSAGPWTRHGADVHGPAGLLLRGCDGTAETRRQADADAEFVAHARQDVADLLAALASARQPGTVSSDYHLG